MRSIDECQLPATSFPLPGSAPTDPGSPHPDEQRIANCELRTANCGSLPHRTERNHKPVALAAVRQFQSHERRLRGMKPDATTHRRLEASEIERGSCRRHFARIVENCSVEELEREPSILSRPVNRMAIAEAVV